MAYRYSSDWKATKPAALLADFKGDLQGDAYAGYEAMLGDDGSGEPLIPLTRRMGCGMHIRSKFEKATKASDARAASSSVVGFGVDFHNVRRYLTPHEDDCFYEGAAYTARRDPAEGQHQAWPGV